MISNGDDEDDDEEEDFFLDLDTDDLSDHTESDLDSLPKG